MRIRKNASKLLGSAILYLSAPFPPPSDTWDPPSSSNPSLCASSGELCELNQSPWDIYPNLHLFTSSSTEDVDSSPCLKKEALVKDEALEQKVSDAISENHGGILGKSPEKESIESEAKPVRLCKSYLINDKRVDMPKGKEKKTTIKKEKKKTRKKKKNEVTVILCKKNDGTKWFCKRPVLLPHSFCEYHYSQSRSYYSTQKEKDDSDEVESLRKRTKRKENEATTSTNPYYYYGGVWPSITKRRGARNAKKGDSMHVDDDKKVGGREALSVAGGTGEDCPVDDDKESSSSDGVDTRVCKKKRRKPIKYVDLLSL